MNPQPRSSRAAAAQRWFLSERVHLQHAVIVLNAPASGTNAAVLPLKDYFQRTTAR